MSMFFYSALFFGSSIAWLLLFRIFGGSVRNSVLVRVFFLGVIAGPAAGAITLIMQRLLHLDFLSPAISGFFLYFFLVGPVEEFSKFLATFSGAHSHSDFRNSSNGIMIAIATALGFAGGENLLYLYAYGPENTMYRLFLSNAGHATFSIPWGYGLGAILHERAPFALLAYTLLIASLLHGAYDYLLVIGGGGPYAAVSLLLAYTILSFYFIRIERKRNSGRKNRG